MNIFKGDLVPETPPALSYEWQSQSSVPDMDPEVIEIDKSSFVSNSFRKNISTQLDSYSIQPQSTPDIDSVVRRRSDPGLSSVVPERTRSNSQSAESTSMEVLPSNKHLTSGQPALRLDFFDRMPQPGPPVAPHNNPITLPEPVRNIYTERSLRKRRDIQLHPFTIEKLQYKAQVGHAHDSHLSQSEIQRRRAIREKYVCHDNDLLERAAVAAQSSKPMVSRDQRRRHDPQNQHSHHRQIHKRKTVTPSTGIWTSRKPRMMATYGKKRAIAISNSDTDTHIEHTVSPVMQESRTPAPTQSTSRKSMQQQLDLLFPEFAMEPVDNYEKDTRRKKRRRVIQDESDSEINNDGSVTYLGEAGNGESSDTSDTEEQSLESRQSKMGKGVDVLRERKALKGILPMSFTKVFSKQLSEDQKFLESRRANQQKNRRRGVVEARSLAKQVNELSISSDQENLQGTVSNFTTETLNANDIFTDEEEEEENENREDNDDSIWDLNDWLEQADAREKTYGFPMDTDNADTDFQLSVLRDKDPIDRMIIRTATTKRSTKKKLSTKSLSAGTSQKRVLKYNYRVSAMQGSGQGKKTSKPRTTSRQSKQGSKQSSGSARPRQQHIWRFMDVRKSRSSPSPAPMSQADSILEAEDQFFKLKAANRDDLPAWVQALLQTRQDLKPKEKEKTRSVRPIIPSGVGPFYQSVADVTKVNWWQRHGRRRPRIDALENTEPMDIQADIRHWNKATSQTTDIDSDIQIVNPRVRPRPSKILPSKRPTHRAKQSNLFSDHGFIKDQTSTRRIQHKQPPPSHAHQVVNSPPRAALPSPLRSSPTAAQLSFIQFLNDTRVFPVSFSHIALGVEWHLPNNGYIKQGFLKTLEDAKLMMTKDKVTISEYDQLVTDSGTFNVFHRCFNINNVSVQETLDITLSFFGEAMKTIQDIFLERKAVDTDTFTTELCEFLSFVTICLGHWVPLLSASEQQSCVEILSKETISFQKRLVKLTRLQSTLSSGDPAASLSVPVTQVLLMWFIFSNDWGHRIQQLGPSCRLLQCNSLDLMQALLLWLGPEPLNTGDSLGQRALEAWIYYFHALTRCNNPLEQFSTLISEIKKACTSDGLDEWYASEMMWQWLFVLKEIQQYDSLGEQRTTQSDHSQFWFAVQDLLKGTAVLNGGEGSLSYTSLLQEMNDHTKELMDDYIRALFSRVHQLCRLYPSPATRYAILQLHSFYLDRRFQDLATEQDSSFPEFFVDFIGYIPNDLSPDDSCFHIFLKTLCITLQTEQESLNDGMMADAEKERKQLRRFLSQLAPTHVMTIRNGDQETGVYTSLGNHFNLNMLFAHVVSSDIMRRSIVQAKSFLNFQDSDHTARKMYFEAFTLLARIYAFHNDRNGLASIVQLLNERLGYLSEEYARMQARQSMAKQGFLPVDDWLADQSDRRELIESAFIYIWKIVRDAVSVADDADAGWFEIAVMSIDQGKKKREKTGRLVVRC